jgi:two-component system OmpR family sensor kinase
MILGGLVVFAGFAISKLSVAPLLEYITNLQNLSNETLHELNLPLCTISTNLHMLRKKVSDEKDLKRVLRIDEACKMLQQRYDELDYMIRAQSLNTKLEEFELNLLIIQRVSFLNQIYPHFEFELFLDKTIVKSDKTGLSKTIDNLLDNGIKYSKESRKITVILQKNILSIRDYGCGMDTIELLKIFDNYYQTDKNMRGFGIGLNMVKRFCDLNSIKLLIESKPDDGTTVKLYF